MNLKKDWLLISDMAYDYTNYVEADDDIAAESKRKELVVALKDAIVTHGNVPYLLETLADYTPNISKKLRLFEHAFRLNVAVSNYNDSLSCANSALRAAMIDGLDEYIRIWQPKVLEYSSKADDLDWIRDAKKLLSGDLW